MKKIICLLFAVSFLCVLCSSCTFTVWRRIDRPIQSSNRPSAQASSQMSGDFSVSRNPSEPVQPETVPTVKCENDVFEITPDEFQRYFNQLLPSYKNPLGDFILNQYGTLDADLSCFEVSPDLNLKVMLGCDKKTNYIQEVIFELSIENADWETYRPYVEALIRLLDPLGTDYNELAGLLGLGNEGLMEPMVVYNANGSRIYLYQYDPASHLGTLGFASASWVEKLWEQAEEELSSDYEEPDIYEIGVDLPAGEYVLIPEDADQGGYFSVTYSEPGSGGATFANGMVLNRSIVTVKDYFYLSTERCTIYPIEEAPPVDTSSGVLSSGMYLVGADIPAGTYTVRPDEGKTGLVSIESDSLHQPNSVLDTQRFDSETSITVQDGQYLVLTSSQLILS
nr:hypothetical protein [uncultured Solibaculum sp.]